MTAVTIDPRFHGPPDSANGGYACGLVAGAVDRHVSVSLRVPPPLGRPLELTVDGDGARLTDGEVLVGEAAPFDGPWPQVPTVVTVDEATAASERFIGFETHIFPTCWVCGPRRPDGDGLHVFPGRLDGGDPTSPVASAWTPDADVDAGDGTVQPEHVWAALDCPTYFGAADGEPALLASMAADLRGPVRVGEPHVVLGWGSGGGEGRKRHAASAVLDADGRVLAVATTLWVTLSAEALQALLEGA